MKNFVMGEKDEDHGFSVILPNEELDVIDDLTLRQALQFASMAARDRAVRYGGSVVGWGHIYRGYAHKVATVLSPLTEERRLYLLNNLRRH